jgi:hypothetical protein
MICTSFGRSGNDGNEVGTLTSLAAGTAPELTDACMAISGSDTDIDAEAVLRRRYVVCALNGGIERPVPESA